MALHSSERVLARLHLRVHFAGLPAQSTMVALQQGKQELGHLQLYQHRLYRPNLGEGEHVWVIANAIDWSFRKGVLCVHDCLTGTGLDAQHSLLEETTITDGPASLSHPHVFVVGLLYYGRDATRQATNGVVTCPFDAKDENMALLLLCSIASALTFQHSLAQVISNIITNSIALRHEE
eukprot:scaffold223_cov408-Prasinococcus_capsulatus_cf.AAC.3